MARRKLILDVDAGTDLRSGREPNARVALPADMERFGRFVLDTLING